MLDIFAKYATDEAKELEGVEIELGGGATITVARAENVNYLRRLVELGESHEKMLAALPPDEAARKDAEVFCQILAETILLDFEGLGYQGEPLEYSVENAKKLLAVKDFRVLVMKHAQNVENFRIKQVEEDSGN